MPHTTSTSSFALDQVENQAAPSSNLTFHLFNSLATELRLKIWAYACTPRTVSLRYLPNTDMIHSSTSVPTLLHVTRESRYEALRIYSLRFGTLKNEPQIYFSPALDTIYIPRYRKMGYDETLRDFRTFLRHPAEIDDVKWLALDYVDGKEKRPWEAYDKAVLISSFSALENVLLVLTKQGDQTEPATGVIFGEPRLQREEVTRIWWEFKSAWIAEESQRMDIDQELGRERTRWVLPFLKVVEKMT